MNSPLRILHVTTYLHPDRFGGAERVVDGLARAQARAGHEVVVVAGNLARGISDQVSGGVRWLFFELPSGARGWRFFRRAHRACRALLKNLAGREFDLVHTHQPATALCPRGIPGLAHLRVHSFYAPYHAEWAVEQGRFEPDGRPDLGHRLKRHALARLDRLCLDRAGRVVVLSETSRRQVLELHDQIAGRIAHVPPGVDLDRFHPAPSRSPNRRPLILTVRRLVRRMGLDLALEAASLLRARGCAFDLLMAGEGPLFSELEDSIRRTGLCDRVRLIGPVPESELPELYRAADLFLLPTRRLEGFGLVTLEALACGTPVIATDVGANGEVLRDLLPECPPVPARPEALAAALEQAFDRIEPLRDAASRSASRVAEVYGWPAAALRLERVYREALAREPVA